MKYDCGRRIRTTLTGYTQQGDLYICDRCNRSYKHFNSIKRHKTYECDKQPSFCCPVLDCNYKAKINCRMLQHVRMVHKIDC